MTRRNRWLAWVVFGVIVAEIVGALLLVASRKDVPGSDATGLATVLFVLVTASVGTLIELRRPGNTIGLLLLVAAFGFAGGGLLVTYVEIASSRAESLSPLAVWLGDIMFQLGVGVSATFLLLLFPTGRLPSRGWRVVGWVAAFGIAASVLEVILGPSAFEGLPIENPIVLPPSHPVLRVVEEGALYLPLAAALASVASLIVRYRRAGGEEKQQLKWVAFAVVVLAIGLAGTVGWDALNPRSSLSDDTQNLVIAVSLTVVPISIGMAILRYRLYDIDRIISRTVSYGAVTAALAAAYGTLVFVLGNLVPAEGSSLVVAASTLAVAGLFNPLRRRVQALVDRRFNRSRYDSARIVERFSGQLGAGTDLERLGHEFQIVTASIMHPQSMSLWVREREHGR